MKKKPAPLPEPEPSPSPRFLKRPSTIKTLDEINDSLEVLNHDYHYLSRDKNPRETQPYEGITLFAIDQQMSDRAAIIRHSPTYEPWSYRTGDYAREALIGRRVILSQSTLGQALQEDGRGPTFRSSLTHPGERIVWTHPLTADPEAGLTAERSSGYAKEPAIGAIQLAYSVNGNPNWNYPTNDEVEAVWQYNHHAVQNITQALRSLLKHTTSISRGLELEPPLNPDTFVVHWRTRSTNQNRLLREYPITEAYLEAWRAECQELASKYGAEVINGSAGDYITFSLTGARVKTYLPHEVRRFGKKSVQPFIEQLIDRHQLVAKAFHPDIFPKLSLGVGLGNVEEGPDGTPAGAVLWEVDNCYNNEAVLDKPITYTTAAQRALFG